MGDTLNALPISLLVVTALLMTGCGEPAKQATAEPAMSPSQAAAASNKATVPLLTTCLSLFGEGTGLAKETLLFINGLESLDADNAQKAGTLASRLGEVADTAKPELAQPVGVMQTILEDYVRAYEDSGSWSTGQRYPDAKNAISEVCTPEINAAAQSNTAAPALTDDEKFLQALRSAHPAMKSTDTENQLEIANTFCDVYDKGVENGKLSGAITLSDNLVTAPAGIKFTLEELKSIRKLGVSTFCPQHLDKLP